MDYEDLSQIVSHTRFNLYCHLVLTRILFIWCQCHMIHLISLESVQQFMLFVPWSTYIFNYIY